MLKEKWVLKNKVFWFINCRLECRWKWFLLSFFFPFFIIWKMPTIFFSLSLSSFLSEEAEEEEEIDGCPQDWGTSYCPSGAFDSWVEFLSYIYTLPSKKISGLSSFVSFFLLFTLLFPYVYVYMCVCIYIYGGF